MSKRTASVNTVRAGAASGTVDAPLALSGVHVGALVDRVQQLGISPETLLGRCVEGSVGARVPLPEFQRLLMRGIALTGRPALGLECGLHASEASFGLMGPLVSHTTTLRHAIGLVCQFHPLLLEDSRLRLHEHLDRAQVFCSFPRMHAPADCSVSELVVAGVVRTLRSFGCSPAELHAVYFEHARPAHHQAYAQAFGGAERFGHAFTGVEFARHVLDRPHIHQQPELEQLLRGQAERALHSLAHPQPSSDRLRALVRRHGAELDMVRASRELKLSVRSLRRRLQGEGTSYRALTQSALQEWACALLRDRELTLQEIAHALRFADATTFHHAFKRWTKSTPTEYRESLLQVQ